MAANISDKITDTFNVQNPTSTTVSSPRSVGVTTLACANLAGWPTASAVHFATYKIDTNSKKIAGSQVDWKGIVSGSNLTSIQVVNGTDAGNAIGDVVEMMPTAKWGQDLSDALMLEHGRTGVHALTSNSTITSSKVITGLNDTNGNQMIGVSPTASSVNNLQVTNAATGNAPQLASVGTDSNIDLKITPKGTGRVVLNGAGAGGYNGVATSQTRTSSTAGDLATVGPSVTVTIGNSGLALMSISCAAFNSTTDYCIVYITISGANTVAATQYAVMQGTNQVQIGNVVLLTGLTAGSTTFKMQYANFNNSSTATFLNRQISVIPL